METGNFWKKNASAGVPVLEQAGWRLGEAVGKEVEGGGRREGFARRCLKFLRNQKSADFFENAMVVALVYRGFMRK